MTRVGIKSVFFIKILAKLDNMVTKKKALAPTKMAFLWGGKMT
jgi:hypothetical protein